ncbi:Uncharacterized protein TCM_037627 [Theobroma cacao]|uniref:Uncharacterized protein n=1 Tax=Theobroma cacao TaxID=3641 RepID=A0A061GTD9_THECC|nr:Uncharacterized protein TCM_037627 [Theobroma cacao]
MMLLLNKIKFQSSRGVPLTLNRVLKARVESFMGAKKHVVECWEDLDQGHQTVGASVDAALLVWPLKFLQLLINWEFNMPIMNLKDGNANVAPLSSIHKCLGSIPTAFLALLLSLIICVCVFVYVYLSALPHVVYSISLLSFFLCFCSFFFFFSSY